MKWGYPGGLSVRAVLTKAAEECAAEGGIPVGVWKQQRKDGIAFMYLDDFLEIVKKAYGSE